MEASSTTVLIVHAALVVVVIAAAATLRALGELDSATVAGVLGTAIGFAVGSRGAMAAVTRPQGGASDPPGGG